MLKLRKGFRINKLKFWGFYEKDDKWFKDIDDLGWLSLQIDEDRVVKYNFLAGDDVLQDYEFTFEFSQATFDLIKAEVFVWN